MHVKQERWAPVGTSAVIVAVMAATWLMCENVLAWRDTFRLEDLTYARNQVDDFEAYRSGGVFESGMAWGALVVALIAIVLAAVAGVRARRWSPTFTAVGAAGLMAFVAAGTLFPFGPFVLLICALPATVAVRSLSRSSNERNGAGVRGL
ncbi:hypothetical protein M1843_03975 [Isoptericola sp. 4D.3]|uniref:Integral membrane protein n=1 Tax=Isoptericola peretonis TaxID=2918523 RepID=A0ABT0J080_9MICO|nr:hypothetical protein [Isoptericola sp. 4D.3]